jgi:hypothetical protein
MKLSKKQMRWTGILYLLVIILAGFSQGYVRGTLVDSSSPTATSTAILDNVHLFRLGITTDLLAFMIDAVLSILFFRMFSGTDRLLSMISAALRLVAHPAIGSINLLNHYLSLQVLVSPDLSSQFDSAQLQAASLVLLDAHRIGYLIAGGFFGVHCYLLGRLIMRSVFIPKVFGWLLVLSAIGYVMETFGNLLVPGNEVLLASIVGISAVVGEVSLTLYLIIQGKKTTG